MNEIQVSDIKYPIFILGKTKPQSKEGVLYYISNKMNLDTGEDLSSIRIVDDKNIEGDSLAKRRLLLQSEKINLVPLRKSIFFLGDLIKLANPNLWFIDSDGKVFNYKKSSRVKLKFHLITNIIKIPSGGAILCLEGIPTRFKSLYAPEIENTHAGVLHHGKSLLLYGFFDAKYDDTWRMI
jgi:hypothetical protein